MTLITAYLLFLTNTHTQNASLPQFKADFGIMLKKIHRKVQYHVFFDNHLQKFNIITQRKVMAPLCPGVLHSYESICVQFESKSEIQRKAWVWKRCIKWIIHDRSVFGLSNLSKVEIVTASTLLILCSNS